MNAVKRLQRVLRWLYPGIGIKRWAGLAVVGALLTMSGVLAWFGRDLVRAVYAYLSPQRQSSYWVAALLIWLGLGMLVVGISRTVHAIVRGIAPESEGRASEVLYSQHRLRRGPRVVTVGGGTGLSSLLRGLKHWTSNISAVVTVMDDGGSSGRLREEMHMLPPGDIRNCLIALAEDESHIASLFQHRFHGGSGSLDGHSLGNLMLAGLQQHTGRFDTAIEELSHILKVRGQVLPTTLEDVKLVAELEDGHQLVGEVNIAADPRPIKRMGLSYPHVQPYRKVTQAIEAADLIVLGPGSLFTSVVPNLLVEGVAQTIERSKAIKIYVANLMTQPGETDTFSLSDHLKALDHYFDTQTLDCVIANNQSFPEALKQRYMAQGAVPVVLDDVSSITGAKVVAETLCEVVKRTDKETLKHHSEHLARAIMRCARL